MITTQEFIEKWRRAELSESSASREHFLDLCDLLEVDRPAKADPRFAIVREAGGDAGAGCGLRPILDLLSSGSDNPLR